MICETEREALLAQRLARHPQLCARVERLLAVVEDAAGDVVKADAAERRVIEELRHLGQEALTAWAERSVDRIETEAAAEPEVRCGGKNFYWHTTFGTITVREPLWRVGTKVERRFRERAEVECRGYSLPLQRALTDFGADHPFGRVPSKLKEHYGIGVPVGAIQRITEPHAQVCYEQEHARTVETPAEGSGVFIGERDGSMVPVVETDPEAPDRRRARILSWKEARLCLVHRHGEVTSAFGGHFQGGVEESGRQFKQCAARAGFGRDSELHAVGDGAPWIADQVDLQFGAQGHYLVDFYHVSEYLAAAAKACAANAPEVWVDEQELRLKTHQAESRNGSKAPACGGRPIMSKPCWLYG